MTQMTDICPSPIQFKMSGDMVDIGHAKTEQTVYIEKTPMFVRFAFGDSKHSSHRLYLNMRKTGFIWISD